MNEIYGSTEKTEWEIIRVRKKNFGQEIELRIRNNSTNEIIKKTITVETLVDLFINKPLYKDMLVAIEDCMNFFAYHSYWED